MLELIKPFNYADVMIILIILFCVLISMRRGMMVEVIAIGSWVAAIFVARTYGELAALEVIGDRIENLHIRYLVAAGGLFVCTLLAGKALSYIVSTFVKTGPLRGADRVLGAFFGVGRGLLIVCIGIAFLGLTHTTGELWWRDSILMAYLQPWAEWMVSLLPPNLAGYFEFPPLR
ncbi:MAG: CvpA family protein [Granulosicoccaceae bacterium]